jgi:hypothetical protein
MRILMLTDLYPAVVGGVEQHVRVLSAELAARGHDVAVATLWQHGLPEFEVEDGVRVYRIRGTTQRVRQLFSDGVRRYAPPVPDPETAWALADVIVRERPAIVHAHNWLVHSFLPLKSWSRARLVMSVHDFNLVRARKKFLHRSAPCVGPALLKSLHCCVGHYGMPHGVPTVLANQAMGVLEKTAVDLFYRSARRSPLAAASSAGLCRTGSSRTSCRTSSMGTERPRMPLWRSCLASPTCSSWACWDVTRASASCSRRMPTYRRRRHSCSSAQRGRTRHVSSHPTSSS